MSKHATVTALPTGPRPTQLNELTRRVVDDGKCAGTSDYDTYFPEQATPADARKACAGCPVIAECLERALCLGITDGIFGGKTPEQRQRMTRSPKRFRQAVA